MSYRLIDANDLNGKISEKDYEVVLNAPCIYADLPKGLDGRYYGLTKREKKSEWIPVSERLPEDYVAVMATVDGYVVPEARYSKEDGWEWAYESGADYWVELDDVVIAWMPWPSPYKAESEDEK